MHNFVLSPIDPDRLIEQIAQRVTANLLHLVGKNQISLKPEGATPDNSKRIVDAGALAKYLNIPVSSIYGKVHRGKLPAKRMPSTRKLYFDLDEIDNLLNQ